MTTCKHLARRSASGAGSGSSFCTWHIEPGITKRNATGVGTGSSTIVGGETLYLYFALAGWREPAPVCGREPPSFNYHEPVVTENKV